MKKKLLAMLFISLLTLSACQNGVPETTTEPPQITTEAPEATTAPPEVTTAEPRPYTAFGENRDGGYFESDGEYIYFIHPETFGLYRLRGDMTEPQCLHDMTCTSLFLDGDTLYFIGRMTCSVFSDHYLYAMDTDGQNQQRLGSIGSDRYRILSVTDDRIHIMSPSGYATLSYDKATGLHEKCIPEITGYDHWLFHDGMLYFTSHGAHEYQLPAGLYRMQDDFKAREKLTDREALYTLAAEDKLLFTTAMGELWSIQPDGSGETRLADGIYGPLALSGDTLFHTDRQGRLCSLDLTTGTSVVLPEQRPADRLEAIGDTVFLIRDQSTPTTTLYDIRELEYARMHTDGTDLLPYTPPTVEPVETIIPIPDTVHGQGGRSVADGDTEIILALLYRGMDDLHGPVQMWPITANTSLEIRKVAALVAISALH